MTTVKFSKLDYANAEDARILIEMLDAYACDPMGGGEPLSQYSRENLPAAMAATPGAFTIVAYLEGSPVALANCFTALSTFAAKPLVNIHDLAVIESGRGKGIATALLDAVEKEALERGCCKVTLEVLSGNTPAKRAYEKFGFEAYTLDDATGGALFMQKKLPV